MGTLFNATAFPYHFLHSTTSFPSAGCHNSQTLAMCAHLAYCNMYYYLLVGLLMTLQLVHICDCCCMLLCESLFHSSKDPGIRIQKYWRRALKPHKYTNKATYHRLMAMPMTNSLSQNSIQSPLSGPLQSLMESSKPPGVYKHPYYPPIYIHICTIFSVEYPKSCINSF